MRAYPDERDRIIARQGLEVRLLQQALRRICRQKHATLADDQSCPVCIAEDALATTVKAPCLTPHKADQIIDVPQAMIAAGYSLLKGVDTGQAPATEICQLAVDIYQAMYAARELPE